MVATNPTHFSADLTPFLVSYIIFFPLYSFSYEKYVQTKKNEFKKKLPQIYIFWEGVMLGVSGNLFFFRLTTRVNATFNPILPS